MNYLYTLRTTKLWSNSVYDHRAPVNSGTKWKQRPVFVPQESAALCVLTVVTELVRAKQPASAAELHSCETR